jgi:alpha-methylacyl-CoA racemase
MPKTLLTDIAAAERTVSTALRLILARERGYAVNYSEVSIAEAGEIFAAPLRFGLTSPKGVFGGGFAGYDLYQTLQGWIALTTLEPKFQEKLLSEFNLSDAAREKLQRIFLTKTAHQWEQWAITKDIPLKAVID